MATELDNATTRCAICGFAIRMARDGSYLHRMPMAMVPPGAYATRGAIETWAEDLEGWIRSTGTHRATPAVAA